MPFRCSRVPKINPHWRKLSLSTMVSLERSCTQCFATPLENFEWPPWKGSELLEKDSCDKGLNPMLPKHCFHPVSLHMTVYTDSAVFICAAKLTLYFLALSIYSAQKVLTLCSILLQCMNVVTPTHLLIDPRTTCYYEVRQCLLIKAASRRMFGILSCEIRFMILRYWHATYILLLKPELSVNYKSILSIDCAFAKIECCLQMIYFLTGRLLRCRPQSMYPFRSWVLW